MNIVFMGTPDFAVASLQSLIDAGLKPVLCVSQPDRPQGRKQTITPTPVKALALQHDIPVLQPTKLKTGDFPQQLASFEPDLIVTAAYGRILPENILQLPKLGCINVHGSILPKYRGAAPVQQAIINGDTETGITILRMTKDMDAGNILRIAKLKIKDEHTGASLMQDLAKLGGEILPSVVNDLVDGKITEIEQNDAEAVYVTMLSRESGKIDFSATDRQIFNLVRATFPWPCAYTYYNHKRLKVLASHIPPEADNLKSEWQKYPVGTVLPAPKHNLWIKAGIGVIALDEVQLDGGKKLLAKDVAHNFTVGTVLGAEI